ncbi:MAG: hypothetical protein DRN12_07185, partial [Thermoplasmata archaeon]
VDIHLFYVRLELDGLAEDIENNWIYIVPYRYSRNYFIKYVFSDIHIDHSYVIGTVCYFPRKSNILDIYPLSIVIHYIISTWRYENKS